MKSDFKIPAISLLILLSLLFVNVSDASQRYCGVGSYYHSKFQGRKTANGERFNNNALTAAHKSLKFNTRVKVFYGNKSVIVRINDRGPFVGGRILDLSQAAAKQIGMYNKGVGKICYVILK